MTLVPISMPYSCLCLDAMNPCVYWATWQYPLCATIPDTESRAVRLHRDRPQCYGVFAAWSWYMDQVVYEHGPRIVAFYLFPVSFCFKFLLVCLVSTLNSCLSCFFLFSLWYCFRLFRISHSDSCHLSIRLAWQHMHKMSARIIARLENGSPFVYTSLNTTAGTRAWIVTIQFGFDCRSRLNFSLFILLRSGAEFSTQSLRTEGFRPSKFVLNCTC